MHYITPGLFTKPLYQYKAYVIQKIIKIKEKTNTRIKKYILHALKKKPSKATPI